MQILSASVVSVGMMAGVAAADTTSCNISNTGNGSVNSCTNTTTNKTTIFCTNNVDITNDNYQDAKSGTVTVDSNTSAGGATSGDAHNSALNQVAANLGCGTATTVATATPVTPGKGAAAPTPAPAAAPASTTVASLPHTGSNTVLDASIASVAVLGGSIAVSRFGVSAYRRLALK